MFMFDVLDVIMVVYSVQLAYYFLFRKLSHFQQLRQGACTAKIKANNYIES